MDAEQQVRLNFLEEADECCDRIETSFLGISDSVAEPTKLDLALRSSHSIKGGAAMMSYPVLSESAHRLEDFLKILRVRFSNLSIETQIESLVLQCVDRLRDLSQFYRNNQDITEAWLEQNLYPIFEQLQNQLGDLQDSDEDLLLNQSQEIDPALLIFEEGVDARLNEFEAKLPTLREEDISEVLEKLCNELLNFGYMAELDPFIALCNSVSAEAAQLPTSQLKELGTNALAIWRRSHALVVRGSLDKLPQSLDLENQDTDVPASHDVTTFEESLNDFPELSEQDLLELQGDFSIEVNPADSLPIPVEETTQSQPVIEAEDEFNELEDIVDPFSSLSFDADLLESLQETFNQDLTTPESIGSDSVEQDNEVQTKTLEPVIPASKPQPVASGRTVKISADQLYQFNSIFSKLVLERNAVNLRLEQLQEFSELLQRRMTQLSKSNTQLRQWYDRASMEGVIPTEANAAVTPVSQPTSSATRITEQFDSLEMDQYTDLHLISQNQIETVVQLQEVTADIDTGLRAMEKAVQGLNSNTQLLQKNVTQTQMIPFEDVVKRFPRVIRDLNLKYQKSVNLIIEGQSTPIDRSIIDSLGDALLHLLRNAFDHGIEDDHERIAKGKSSQGTIRLRAENRSSETVITLEDDGSGIKLHQIRDRLIHLGLAASDVESMQESELLDYIFEPGFSTASQVTEVSGRGVGMDLVRNNLSEIRGQVTVTSLEGQGTTFSLKVPYSLSIMTVVLMERAGLFFAMPIDSVREVIRLPSEDSIKNGQCSWNNREVNVLALENFLQYQRPQQRFEMTGNPVINQTTLIIVGRDENLSAIALDRFWGEQEVTIRPISDALPLPAGFNSSMVMGDGRVLPLIDPSQLIDWCQSQAPRAIPLDQRMQVISEEQTILVVDDSINVRNFLTITLEKAGYRVEQAKDGQDAVDKLQRGLQVNAVICDIEMPRLDGYSFLEEVKGRKKYEKLPVIMLTSRSNEKHRKVAMNLGANGYFSKPFNEAKLLESLSKVMAIV